MRIGRDENMSILGLKLDLTYLYFHELTPCTICAWDKTYLFAFFPMPSKEKSPKIRQKSQDIYVQFIAGNKQFK